MTIITCRTALEIAFHEGLGGWQQKFPTYRSDGEGNIVPNDLPDEAAAVAVEERQNAAE